MMALVAGGSASGKSALAEGLAAQLPAERKVYLATMPDAGAEAAERIARHRRSRAGLGFETLECQKGLRGVQVPFGACVLLEDVPCLLANELFDGGRPEDVAADILDLACRCRHLVIVSGDLFSDGRRYGAETEDYLKRLAGINRQLAQSADLVLEAVCSVPVLWKGEWPCTT